ncbi:MAG: hypothetical protein HKN30_04315 [Sulfitobacter sp.]|nr:hypothetical protein [Sulfitobacter sp.]
MKYLVAAGLALSLAACAASSNAPTVSAPGLDPKSRISVLFQEFPAGTACAVQLPQGTLKNAAMPGKIDYPTANAGAPVSCQSPDGTRYRVDVQSVLPAGPFRIAGLTAYGTGLIVSTVSGEALTSQRNERGVTPIR